MAAHRYWRIQPITQFSGQTGWGEVIMAGVPGGPSLLVGGTVSAQATYGGTYAPERAMDGNTGTNWFGGGMFLWWQYDFGSAVEINEVRIAPAIEDQSPHGFAVQSSDDGVVWANEWLGFRFADWVGNQYVAFPRPVVAAAARYWGLWMLTSDINSGDVLIVDLALAGAAAGPDLTAPGQAYLARVSGGNVADVFDDSPGSYWYSSGGNNRHVLVADLGVATTVAEARLTTTTEGVNVGRIPAHGKWIASNDAKSFWEVAAYDSVGWAPGESRAFALGTGGGGGGSTGRRRQATVVC